MSSNDVVDPSLLPVLSETEDNSAGGTIEGAVGLLATLKMNRNLRRRRPKPNDAPYDMPWKQLSKTTRVMLPLDTPEPSPKVLLGRQTDFIHGGTLQTKHFDDSVFNKKQDRQELLRRTLRRRFLDLDPYEMFASFDKNGNGRLTRDELRLGMTLLGMELLHDEMNLVFAASEKNAQEEASLRSLESKVADMWNDSEYVDAVDAYKGVINRQQKRKEGVALQKSRRERKLMHARAARHQKQANRKDVPPTVRNCLMRMEEKEQKRQLKKNLRKSAERIAIIRAMQASALFAGLPNTVMNEVARDCSKQYLQLGEFITREGEPAHSLLCIVEGTAMMASSDPILGATVVEMASGDLLGEGVLYEENGVRTADVRVKDADGVFCAGLGRELLRGLVTKFPMFAARVKQQESEFERNGHKAFRRQHKTTTRRRHRQSFVVEMNMPFLPPPSESMAAGAPSTLGALGARPSVVRRAPKGRNSILPSTEDSLTVGGLAGSTTISFPALTGK
jgi:CRP-like cAMP-binding protein